MSPRRTVTFQRWQVSVFLLAIAGSFVWVGVELTSRVDENRSALIAQREVSRSKTIERKKSDQALCVYVRDHVVKPDRQSVLKGPLSGVSALKLLGFEQSRIDQFLAFQYGGVPADLLVGIGIPPAKARLYSRGKRDGVVEELARRPVPDCGKPLNLDGGG